MKYKNHLKFIILSILGVILYVVPFTLTVDGEPTTTILLSHFTTAVITYLLPLLLVTILISQLITLIGSTIGLFKKSFKSTYLNDLFIATPFQYVLRILGVFTFTIVFLGINGVGSYPQFIVGELTGQVMYGIILTLYCTFFAGVILMPLITKFGAVEFVGTLVSPIMRKVFKVPGYAAIDATASLTMSRYRCSKM